MNLSHRNSFLRSLLSQICPNARSVKLGRCARLDLRAETRVKWATTVLRLVLMLIKYNQSHLLARPVTNKWLRKSHLGFAVSNILFNWYSNASFGSYEHLRIRWNSWFKKKTSLTQFLQGSSPDDARICPPGHYCEEGSPNAVPCEKGLFYLTSLIVKLLGNLLRYLVTYCVT